MAEEAANPKVQNLSAVGNPDSVEVTIASAVGGGATESSCNNNSVECTAVTNDGEPEKTLEYADELISRGSKAAKERDYAEATDCFSRALEIRVSYFGELAPECVNAYYKYGCALLEKAQEEADPFNSMPKKESASQENPSKDSAATVGGESSAASVQKYAGQEGKGEEDDDESDAEELVEGDEDESDLDLAWKMLDIARAIVEKLSGDTMEKVDILSALAEVALEREDVETSLSDYFKALSILERLVQPDSRLIAELNFRICLCLEIGSKPEEAIPYCQKAISVCKSRVQRLSDEVKNLSGQAETLDASKMVQTVQPSSTTSLSGDTKAEKEAEIETLNGLCGDLEKKLEDLQQLVSSPKSFLSDILGIMSEKARAIEKNVSSVAIGSSQKGTAGNIGSPSVSTAHTNGSSEVTDLGVVGRGVKRVLMSSISSSSQSNPAKKPSTDSSNNGDSCSS